MNDDQVTCEVPPWYSYPILMWIPLWVLARIVNVASRYYEIHRPKPEALKD